MTRARLADRFAVIAAEAGTRIMSIYGTASAEAKADGSPLTQADLAAHDAILEGLTRVCPDLPVVSEEDAERLEAPPVGPFILVDPLDGTREFLSGNGEFTVNIALIEGGAPVAGVVLAPALGRLWSGAVGAGARVRDVAVEADRPISVRQPTDGSLVAVASRSHRDATTEAFLAGLSVAGLRSVGSSLKFCLIAEGEADVYPRFGPTMEWDTAAGQAVLEAAGGRVVTPEGAPFRYGKAGAAWRNGAFVAWGGAPRPG
ncbi:3'(2'),5'-bisphosphate nucleotidase CysQ [Neoroseomonas soli]|uniref:3'(2'),5'-bisphosphate nucleotidase CysQ n=1 Tax=Neoroseomonas soli TaxID=1081025 RepID=A0A9X9WXP0_9PROT|nr:3'(2'),5'-bisphosphate nucleotidase CysQ [Neoroseomonas soli]MBR0671919.1 3'(2'),5'-bisphosphate nucleotidase CysQ [Neoroseomonas soli]